jgi:hypothetical protein
MQLQDLSVYYNNRNSILIVNKTGVLKTLYCPFKVVCIYGVQGLLPGTFVWVEEVICNTRDELIYIILNHHYHYSYFIITISF